MRIYGQGSFNVVLRNQFPCLDESWLITLSLDLVDDEIKPTLFSLDPLKALGEDGFLALFYQSNWKEVGNFSCSFLKEVWHHHENIKQVNETLLVLFPKIDKPEFFSQFRSISLSNVTYKCLTKIIANRIIPLLQDYISPYQASFVPGRHIQDNIIIAHEPVHTMRKMKGSKGFMSIKIDLEKVHNRLSWHFI